MSGPRVQAVVIGASAGAVQVLSRILPALAADYPVPVLVVVHVPSEGSDIATLFQAKCRAQVKEAEDKEAIVPGVVYFAPADYHLLVEADHTISLSTDDPVLYSRPSIDVLFESAADAYGDGLAAVILTGANEDGAKGLAAVAEAGGVTVVEKPDDAFAAAMPAAALAACPRAKAMSLEEIAAFVAGLGTS